MNVVKYERICNLVVVGFLDPDTADYREAVVAASPKVSRADIVAMARLRVCRVASNQHTSNVASSGTRVSNSTTLPESLQTRAG